MGSQDTAERLSLTASVELCQQADAICYNTPTANETEAGLRYGFFLLFLRKFS